MALLEFRSKAAGGFFMMPETFHAVCKVLGIGYAEKGAWPAEDLPGKLETLQREIEKEAQLLAALKKRWEELERRSQVAFLSYEEEEELAEEKKRREQFVSFHTRIFPLLDMMKSAIRAKESVMWGVP